MEGWGKCTKDRKKWLGQRRGLSAEEGAVSRWEQAQFLILLYS